MLKPALCLAVFLLASGLSGCTTDPAPAVASHPAQPIRFDVKTNAQAQQPLLFNTSHDALAILLILSWNDNAVDLRPRILAAGPEHDGNVTANYISSQQPGPGPKVLLLRDQALADALAGCRRPCQWSAAANAWTQYPPNLAWELTAFVFYDPPLPEHGKTWTWEP